MTEHGKLMSDHSNDDGMAMVLFMTTTTNDHGVFTPTSMAMTMDHDHIASTACHGKAHGCPWNFTAMTMTDHGEFINDHSNNHGMFMGMTMADHD